MRWISSTLSCVQQNSGTLSRMMFSFLCLGLIITQLIMQREVNFVTLCLLLLAAISFWPRVFTEIPRVVRHLKVAGVDVDLNYPESAHVQEKLREAAEKAESEPEPSPTVATTGEDICDIVRTKQIVLHDDNCERARLFVGPDGAVSLELCASSGDRGAALWVSADGVGGLTLADDNGLGRLILNGSDVPLRFRDSNAVERGAFVVDDKNETTLSLMNETGEINCLLTANKDGGWIQAISEGRTCRANLFAVKDLPAFLHLSDNVKRVSTKLMAGGGDQIDSDWTDE